MSSHDDQKSGSSRGGDAGERRVWVLDTETKGTGATMVPLDKVLRRGGGDNAPVFVPRPAAPREPRAPEPRPARTFRVVDVMTREVLAEGTGLRDTVAALRNARSTVDVTIFAWNPETESWRLLLPGEVRTLWAFRDAAEDRDPGVA